MFFRLAGERCTLVVPKAGKDGEATCPVCGGPIDEAGSKCTRCGAAYVAPGERKPRKKVQIALGKKDRHDAPHENPAEAAPAKQQALPAEGDGALAKWLSGEEEEKGLTDWLGGTKGEPKPKAKPAQKPAAPGEKDSNVDALKAWLSGEEDTLSSWLGEDPTAKAKKEPSAVPSAVSDEVSRELGERERALTEKENELRKRDEGLESLRGTLQAQLAKVQTGEFDPMVLIEETARLNRDLQAESRKRKELEEEIVQVKKGSIAVIKYVKAQQMQRGGDAARSIHKRLDEITAEKEKLAVELKKTMEINDKLKKDMTEGLKALPEGDRAAKEKEIALMEKEKQLEASKAELTAKERQLREAVVSSGGGTASAELQQRLMAELGEKEKEWLKNEGELKKRILDLEANIEELKIVQKQAQEAAELKGKGVEVNAELERKIRELQIKEKAMLLREEEIRRLSQQLKDKDEELKKVKEPLKYKEEELLRREEDLLHREKILMEERRKYEEAVKDTGSLQGHEMKLKIEELNQEINRKEEMIRTKEQYLNAKMEDLRLREQGLIGQEIEAREEDRKLELKIEKVKTGTSRLDDLLLGGIPFGTNVLVYGPPFTGKEITINAFVADGLKKGVPAIWVITDKLPSEIREEMMFIVSGYEEYEKLGLVKYIDAYSKSIGEVTPDPNVTYIDEATDHVGILKAVDAAAKELLQKHKYYRLGFRSISTLIAYLDSNTAFKFLQPFVGRRKRERAVSLFSIEKGMHNEQDIQMIGSLMDGALDYKIEQLKTFLCVKGIGDVQSRAWIEYTYSKQGMAVGSFSLDHIR